MFVPSLSLCHIFCSHFRSKCIDFNNSDKDNDDKYEARMLEIDTPPLHCEYTRSHSKECAARWNAYKAIGHVVEWEKREGRVHVLLLQSHYSANHEYPV